MSKSWYAIYSSPRAEKRAEAELQKSGIEVYLPIVRTLKQWSDRKKWVEEPLFRSYLFVCIEQEDYYKVLNTLHVVRYITFERKAVPIPPLQIEAIRQFIADDAPLPDNIEEYKAGSTIEVIKGPMKGLLGEMMSRAGKHRVRVEIAGIGQEIYLTIPVSYLRIVKD